MEPLPQSQPIPHASSAPTPSHYADSANSSPRCRNDAWDPATAGAGEQNTLPSKIRLMCSYGGHIVPRPHDKSLCYVGGETRIVVVDRHVTSLSSLTAHLGKSLLNGRPFTLKYQLPNEDLDSLITVSTDEDLENMIDEHDRAVKSSRLRLFLFPLKPESAQSNIGPILDSSPKSEDWFLTALNRGFSESAAPANSLLNLNDDDAAEILANSDSGGCRDDSKGAKQDVHSVPDSPMLDTASSFGSTSSSPSMANLPAIRVRVDESGGQRLGIEDQFASMVMGAGLGQKYDDALVVQSPPPPMPSGLQIPTSGAFVGGEFQSRVVSDDERSDHGVPIGYRRVVQVQQQQQPQTLAALQSQQKQSGVLELASPDSVASNDGSLANPLARGKPSLYQDQVMQVQAGTTRSNLVDPMISLSESGGYLLQPQQQQPQQQQPQQQQPQQQQQQFVQGGTHYIQNPTGSVPMTAYYPLYQPQQQQQPPHHLDQQYAMYYTRPQTQPPTAATAMAPPSYRTSGKPEMGSSPMYRVAAPGGGTQLVQMQPPSQQQPPQYVGYSQIHHHPAQSMAAPTSAGYGYEYANTAPLPPHNSQIYYTQYQTIPTAGVAMPEESGKQQIRTSQPL